MTCHSNVATMGKKTVQLPRAPARGKCETWESVLVISTQISYPEPQREGSVRHGSLFLLSLHKSATQSPSEREV
ncbi:hypothetical protein RRG08_059787 [Elysia crispata]|uniref:Uncharacterized protein n=1 Tax=Elysia crispata TaxID=231223 RepID=A0AAE1EG05_9GAST|nr:hypothetical protein RRG08_059787 [Elysia crispata]